MIELVVDDKILLARIEGRASETVAAGGAVRADDNPESFKKRLAQYHELTAPVSDYYARSANCAKSTAWPIDEVARELDSILGRIFAPPVDSRAKAL